MSMWYCQTGCNLPIDIIHVKTEPPDVTCFIYTVLIIREIKGWLDETYLPPLHLHPWGPKES